GGAGRGSFNHRFGQASRDALQHFNILFPVDLFPFTDGPSTDPETGVVDSLLGRAERTGTAPKTFHLLTNSEYFNRAGSLVHTDATGTKDAGLPSSTRIYMIASAPHGPGPAPGHRRAARDAGRLELSRRVHRRARSARRGNRLLYSVCAHESRTRKDERPAVVDRGALQEPRRIRRKVRRRHARSCPARLPA